MCVSYFAFCPFASHLQQVQHERDDHVHGGRLRALLDRELALQRRARFRRQRHQRSAVLGERLGGLLCARGPRWADAKTTTERLRVHSEFCVFLQETMQIICDTRPDFGFRKRMKFNMVTIVGGYDCLTYWQRKYAPRMWWRKRSSCMKAAVSRLIAASCSAGAARTGAAMTLMSEARVSKTSQR